MKRLLVCTACLASILTVAIAVVMALGEEASKRLFAPGRAGEDAIHRAPSYSKKLRKLLGSDSALSAAPTHLSNLLPCQLGAPAILTVFATMAGRAQGCEVSDLIVGAVSVAMMNVQAMSGATVLTRLLQKPSVVVAVRAAPPEWTGFAKMLASQTPRTRFIRALATTSNAAGRTGLVDQKIGSANRTGQGNTVRLRGHRALLSLGVKPSVALPAAGGLSLPQLYQIPRNRADFEKWRDWRADVDWMEAMSQ